MAERTSATDAQADLWGTKFIMMPNPAYGEWEGAVYSGNWGASAAEKDAMRKGHLRVWDGM